ncbi:SDR family oxidoreductase [Flavobacteriaceae bacterium]|jgi:NAD(P)-dependent dehydrogenase (short-subunit alcohol dehydrogenase family)|nr:SDR family oxidoreductase [Cryomorphaceae bacterium]MDA8857163.1 SDR family oxidoreductase [Flavobacteriaceae bacterium]MBT3685159.1 SDR family oxidoreductase [Cryomorphaceae bacterium]MBT4237390.1 SDR family oxidoreductase [Cryomorphaceae bacterium]MBT4813355.1 SDR family oxidoreductase [Cryomorphaceae bacterium]
MKNILLIGGSTGIGYELSQKLKKDNNLFISTRDQGKFNDPNIKTHELDLDKEFETDWLPDQLDGFVYLPGTINLRPFKGLKPSVFLDDFNINVMGCVKILQKVLTKIQAAENPSIVMFSTVAVKIGMPFHSSVSSSKGAIEGLTRSLAAEFAPKIRVNSIAPSILDTPLAEKFLNSETKLENSRNRHPLKEIGSPKDISEIVKFLLEDNSKWMTGQIIPFDGGMSSVKTN